VRVSVSAKALSELSQGACVRAGLWRSPARAHASAARAPGRLLASVPGVRAG